ASAVGGIREVVMPEATGLLVPPADPHALAQAINRVLRDPTWARSLGLAGRRRVEQHFSWARVAEQTKRMYEDLLRERSAAAAPEA
ncbi:MAG: glycosyltransferase, partial [Deltaproteobacteria bacterium]|nr:glycosyltransferase [Deltaproteobacteria bacterium]